MHPIRDSEAFHRALASLPLASQRQVGARFIAHVADLSDGQVAQYTGAVADNPRITPEELQGAFRAARSVYVETHPDSDLSVLDFHRQAAHFVAEACMACLAPTYESSPTHHLAERVANYCRMARVCANVPHDAEYPPLSDAEAALKSEIDAQYEVLTDFLKQA
jgi:hypothetical protein